MINRFRFGVKKKESLCVKAPEGWPTSHAPLRQQSALFANPCLLFNQKNEIAVRLIYQ